VSDPVEWQVCIALDPEEVATIDAAMYALEPWERWGLRLPRVEEERAPALLIDVRVESQAQAKDDAVRIYNRARERAGLPTADALVLGTLTPIFADAPHSRLLTEAEGHIETGRREWAVLRAQTACEVYAKKALKRVAMRLPDDARKFRTMTLRDRRDRVVLRAATGVAVGEQSWWPQYELHLQRRDKIVHAGISVSKDEATASLSAARAFVAFLQERWSRAAEGVHSPPL
jgi:hypothetical protein